MASAFLPNIELSQGEAINFYLADELFEISATQSRFIEVGLNELELS